MDKADIRQMYIRKRAELLKDSVEKYSQTVVGKIVELPEYINASTILVYNHVGNELSLDTLLTHPSAAGKRFAFPMCESSILMKAMIPGGWRKGAFGIQEPDPLTSVEVKPEEIDLVICPGVAFDSECHRMGMGGGYYDRFLSKCTNAHIIMAAFDLQFIDHLPYESWDYPMEMVVTEKNIYHI